MSLVDSLKNARTSTEKAHAIAAGIVEQHGANLRIEAAATLSLAYAALAISHRLEGIYWQLDQQGLKR